MVYLSFEDFWEKAYACQRLSRTEEKKLAVAMQTGDICARKRLIQSYIPAVATHVKRCPPHLQTLRLVYTCLEALDKAVDSFDFLQDGETFSHRLSWWLRQVTVAYIADRGN